MVTKAEHKLRMMELAERVGRGQEVADLFNTRWLAEAAWTRYRNAENRIRKAWITPESLRSQRAFFTWSRMVRRYHKGFLEYTPRNRRIDRAQGGPRSAV